MLENKALISETFQMVGTVNNKQHHYIKVPWARQRLVTYQWYWLLMWLLLAARDKIFCIQLCRNRGLLISKYLSVLWTCIVKDCVCDHHSVFLVYKYILMGQAPSNDLDCTHMVLCTSLLRNSSEIETTSVNLSM